MDAIVTLTTDFGLRDPYVAEMKGVILGIVSAAGRDVHLVDVTHEIEAHDVTEGALALEAAAPFFPPGTVHLGVVDPGVGTTRRAIAVSAAGHVFVGPDNGLFTPFLGDGGWQAVEVRSLAHRRPVVSRTFHGRDVFAPAVAHLALGLDLPSLGPPVRDPVRLPWPHVSERAGTVGGTVVHVDRFGNLITSIPAAAIEPLGRAARVRVAGKVLPLVGTYGDLGPGRAGALVGAGNRLEIAVREGSAATVLHAHRGTPVTVSPSRTSSRKPERGR